MTTSSRQRKTPHQENLSQLEGEQKNALPNWNGDSPSVSDSSPNFALSSPPEELPLEMEVLNLPISGTGASTDSEPVTEDAEAIIAMINKEMAEAEKEAAARLKPYKKLIADITEVYAKVGMGFAMVSPLAGSVVISKAEDRATELVWACRNNKTALRWLARIAGSMGIFSAITGHALMLYAVTVAMGSVPLSERNAVLLQGGGYGELVTVIASKQQSADAALT